MNWELEDMRFIIIVVGLILLSIGLIMSWIGAGFAGYSGFNHSMWVQLFYPRQEFLIFQIPFYSGVILLLIGLYRELIHKTDR